MDTGGQETSRKAQPNVAGYKRDNIKILIRASPGQKEELMTTRWSVLGSEAK